MNVYVNYSLCCCICLVCTSMSNSSFQSTGNIPTTCSIHLTLDLLLTCSYIIPSSLVSPTFTLLLNESKILSIFVSPVSVSLWIVPSSESNNLSSSFNFFICVFVASVFFDRFFCNDGAVSSVLCVFLFFKCWVWTFYPYVQNGTIHLFPCDTHTNEGISQWFDRWDSTPFVFLYWCLNGSSSVSLYYHIVLTGNLLM